MTNTPQKLPKTISYIPAWHAHWIKDSFVRRIGATVSEAYMNGFGWKERTIQLGYSSSQQRIISIKEHDAIVAESDQLRLENKAHKNLVAKRKERSKTLIWKILNELT